MQWGASMSRQCSWHHFFKFHSYCIKTINTTLSPNTSLFSAHPASLHTCRFHSAFPIRKLYLPLLLFLVSFLQRLMSMTEENHDWQPDELRRPVIHPSISVSEGYRLSSPPASSIIVLPPSVLSSYLFEWAGNLTIITRHSRNLRETEILRKTSQPPVWHASSPQLKSKRDSLFIRLLKETQLLVKDQSCVSI